MLPVICSKDYWDGTFSDCPIWSRLASTRGFAAIKVSSFTPYLRAIDAGVSPDLTVWVRPGRGMAATRATLLGLAVNAGRAAGTEREDVLPDEAKDEKVALVVVCARALARQASISSR